jgi:hypothetical protein
VRSEADAYVCRVPVTQSLWQRWTGRRSVLEVCVRLTPTRPPAPAATDVEIAIQPVACGRRGDELLQVFAPLLIESVQTSLQVALHGRLQERSAWQHPLQACSLLPDGTAGEPVACQGKDISSEGIGFFWPGDLPTTHLSLRLPQTAQTAAGTVTARVVRVQGCGEGWHEVGAVLLRPA